MSRRDEITWTAGSDGTSHGTRFRRTKTLCGVWPIRPQLAWPKERYCPACLAALRPEEVPISLRR